MSFDESASEGEYDTDFDERVTVLGRHLHKNYPQMFSGIAFSLLAADQAMTALQEAGYEVVRGWVPIETRPKDGADILMRWPDGSILQGKYFDGASTLNGYAAPTGRGYYAGKIGMTHWMPLPHEIAAAQEKE